MMRWTAIRGLVLLCGFCVALLLHPAARVVHAADGDQQTSVTVTGDVRSALSISLADLAALPLSTFSRACGPGQLERFIGVDVLGLVDAAAPRTDDPAGYSVQITGAGGQSVTLPATALDPLISPDHPNGPLLVINDPNGPLATSDGPFFLESGGCDMSKDVPRVQSITVSVTNATADAAPSVDDPRSLFAAGLHADDLPQLAPKYAATRATTPPLPGVATLHYYGYWTAGAALVNASVLTFASADDAAAQVSGFDPTVAVEQAGCAEESLHMLPPLSLGDGDIAYSFRCPGSAGDMVIAVDLFRVGRVVGSLSVTLPAPADPSALVIAGAPIVAGRLAALPQ